MPDANNDLTARLAHLCDLTPDQLRAAVATASSTGDSSGTYDTDDLCRLTKLSKRQMKRLVAARKVPGVIRFGRSLRFSKRVVDKWLAAGR